jgi:orotate phosphoribosyltransferase
MKQSIVDLLPQKREQLKEIIKRDGIVFREVTLSSNLKSDFYYDIKTIVNSEAVVLIGELMLAKIRELFPTTRSIGGLESGALPVTTATVLCSNQLHEEHKLTGFFVRKEAKNHGLQKKIEGIVLNPMIVVDDVVTTGQSVLDAVDALLTDGYSPAGIISVIHREDERNRLRDGVLKYYSLFKHSEFEDFIKAKKQEQKIN